VDAFNSLLARRDEVAANYKLCLDAITDDSEYRRRIADVDKECVQLGDEVSAYLSSLSKCPDEREAINKQYTACIERYNALQDEKKELNSKVALCAAKRIQIKSFLAELRKRKTPLVEFDPLVWQATVSEMVINADMTVLFKFRDGTALPWTIEPGVRQYKKRDKGAGSK
jgi:site-specific DNA recombinase